VHRLPLFPLPIVLLPGAPLPLHIFEARYRQMVADCLSADRRFGLLYHDPDLHGPFHTEPGQVGTVAEILRFQPIPDGRSLILCRGLDRFVVDDGVESSTPYFEAVVAPYDDEPGEMSGVVERRRDSVALFHRILRDAMEYDGEPPQVDLDEEVAFRVAQAFRIDPAWQQRLLETRTELARLDMIDGLLRSVLDAHARGEWHPKVDEA
jgi:ATP-dependent Lon protease